MNMFLLQKIQISGSKCPFNCPFLIPNPLLPTLNPSPLVPTPFPPVSTDQNPFSPSLHTTNCMCI